MKTVPRTCHCSFCAQPLGEVGLRFEGLGACASLICDGCVAGFAEIVAIDRRSPDLAARAVAQINRELGKAGK